MKESEAAEKEKQRLKALEDKQVEDLLELTNKTSLDGVDQLTIELDNSLNEYSSEPLLSKADQIAIICIVLFLIVVLVVALFCLRQR